MFFKYLTLLLVALDGVSSRHLFIDTGLINTKIRGPKTLPLIGSDPSTWSPEIYSNATHWNDSHWNDYHCNDSHWNDSHCNDTDNIEMSKDINVVHTINMIHMIDMDMNMDITKSNTKIYKAYDYDDDEELPEVIQRLFNIFLPKNSKTVRSRRQLLR